MEKLGKQRSAKAIDILSERLTFERSGVRLYDAIMKRARSSGNPELIKLLEHLEQFRNQEKEHEEWLEDQIRSIGGTAHEKTEKALLVERESQGIEKVVLEGDASIPSLFHALLAAELVDNAGWDLLVALADEAGDGDAKREFKKRLHEEEEHLKFVRRIVENFARSELLGEPLSTPS